MIIQELAYKVTVRTDEFLHGKRKLKDEVRNLEGISTVQVATSTRH